MSGVSRQPMHSVWNVMKEKGTRSVWAYHLVGLINRSARSNRTSTIDTSSSDLETGKRTTDWFLFKECQNFLKSTYGTARGMGRVVLDAGCWMLDCFEEHMNGRDSLRYHCLCLAYRMLVNATHSSHEIQQDETTWIGKIARWFDEVGE